MNVLHCCTDPCYPDAGPNSIVQDLNGDPVTVIKDGDFVVYSCPEGYTESGTNHVLCTDGNWVAHIPFKCLAKIDAEKMHIHLMGKQKKDRHLPDPRVAVEHPHKTAALL
ncbi:hypothetical protein HOLleu_29011 [Holothuria leucospilota]|uniref:Sushi domain-containing protein n=1 Tax=Holothuria leucospilota TaxID=206669 RepID=A0A9Q1H100_HOLLE|nr:hypothetical protein HOLleu_29011 [Holothuria leucospilota]